jgi:hypothetical protein
MKPMSASEVLKNSGFAHRNRFDVLRPDYQAGNNAANFRDRTNSVKRKASGDICVENQKKSNVEFRPVLAPQKLDSMERKITIMKGIGKKLNEEAAKVKLDPAMESIIRCVCEFVDVSVSYHEDIVKACEIDVNCRTDTAPREVAEPDQPEQECEVFETYSQATKKPPRVLVQANKPPAKPAKDPKIQAFQDAVKHAERSTLIFNLDLGPKKTLNEKTILTHATLALSAAAAAVEGKNSKTPSRDSVVALDDVMSVTQNVVLYGKVTRPYENKSNPQDPKNKTFFTMPVRYEFKDKETRLEAETILRDTCKIDCTTPYPANLRSCIRQVVDHFRKDYPEDYIKVSVDTENLTLKVSRKVKGDGWYNNKEPIPIPERALDIRSRFAPPDLIMKNLPRRSTRSTGSHHNDPVMDQQDGGSV